MRRNVRLRQGWTALLALLLPLFLAAALSGCGEKADDAPGTDGDGLLEEAQEEEETYGDIIDDGFLRYRLVNGSFYEVFGICEDARTDENGIPRNLTVHASIGGRPVKRIRGAWRPDGPDMGANEENYSEILRGALSNTDLLVSVTVEEGIEEIGEQAFANCGELVRVSIPASVTEIGEGAFDGCALLSEIRVTGSGGAYCVENGALFDRRSGEVLKYPPMKGSTEFSFPAGTKKVAAGAFEGCIFLREIVLPEGTETVGARAFYGCTSLLRAALPESLAEIGEKAFGGTFQLREITVAPGSGHYQSKDGVLFTATGISLLLYPMGKTDAAYTVPEGVQVLDDDAFLDRYDDLMSPEGMPEEGLVSLTLPASLERAGAAFPERFLEEIKMAGKNEKFTAADGVLFSSGGETLLCYPAQKKAERYTVPEGTKRVAENAFRGNPCLRVLTVPASMQSKRFYEGLSDACAALEAVNVTKENPSFRSVDGVLYDAAGEKMLLYPPAKKSESLTLPEGVREVSDDFREARTLKVLTLPSTVQTLQNRYGEWLLPASLSEIRVAAGNADYSAKDGILYDGGGKTLLFYPPEKEDREVVLPAGCETVGENAVLSPTYLESLILPEGMKTVKRWGIKSDRLARLYLPASLTVVEEKGIGVPGSCKVSGGAEKKPAGYVSGWLYGEKGATPGVKWGVTDPGNDGSGD